MSLFFVDRWIPKDGMTGYYQYLSRAECEKLDRFYHEIDRKRSLMGQLVTRFTIAEICGVSLDSIVIEKSEYGKPYYPEIEFNVSHSGNLVVFVCDKNPIGIDVEVIRTMDSLDDFSCTFTKSELSWIKEKKDEISRRFFILWTLKESYIKYLGLGFSFGDLNRLEFKIDTDFQHDSISDLQVQTDPATGINLFTHPTPNPSIHLYIDNKLSNQTFYCYLYTNHIISISTRGRLQ